MSTFTSSVTLDRPSSAENWSLIPSNVTGDFPPMAFPRAMSESHTQQYAVGILRTAGVLLPATDTLTWQHGHGFKSTLRWRTTVEAL